MGVADAQHSSHPSTDSCLLELWLFQDIQPVLAVKTEMLSFWFRGYHPHLTHHPLEDRISALYMEPLFCFIVCWLECCLAAFKKWAASSDAHQCNANYILILQTVYWEKVRSSSRTIMTKKDKKWSRRPTTGRGHSSGCHGNRHNFSSIFTLYLCFVMSGVLSFWQIKIDREAISRKARRWRPWTVQVGM